jgi:VWFA-related protein
VRARMRRHQPAYLLLIILLGISSGNATQAQTKPAPDQAIKINTELIEVRAVVTDRQGRTVGDLKQEDFELLENGRAQEIGFFSLVRLAGKDEAPAAQPPAAPDHTAAPPTNRLRLAATPARTIAIFVDTLHLSATSLLTTKQALRRFVDEQLTDQDLVALVTSGGTLGVVEQFTRDRRILRQAIERLSLRAQPGESLFTTYLAAQIVRGDPQAMDVGIAILKAEEHVDTVMGDRRMLENLVRARANQLLSQGEYQRRVSLLTLKAVAERLADLPGQRLIALLSDGFTLFDARGSPDTKDLQEVTSRAARSGVVIYSLSAKGLQPPSIFSAARGGGIADSRIFSYSSAADKELENSLNALARDTGGEPAFNTNDLRGALQKVLDHNRLYYVLAYYPAEEGKKGQFRQLTLRVKNHPEYQVRAQRGYFIADPAKSKTEAVAETSQQRLEKAMLAPLPTTTIAVSATAGFIESTADDAQVSLQVHIAGDALDYREQDQQYFLALEILTYVYDSTGSIRQTTSEIAQGHLQPDRLALARRNGYRYVRRLTLKPGLYQVRIGVRELSTDRLGTAAAWVEVPNLARSKLALSNIVLLDALTENRAANQDAFQSRIAQGIRIFRRGENLIYYFRVYHQLPPQAEAALLMQTEFLQDGKPIAHSPWQPLATRLVGHDAKGMEAGGQINPGNLLPGIYEMRLTIKDPQSQRTAQQTVTFGVE